MSEEAVYVVRDTAGAIYGPANVPTLRQWIGEGRITRHMHVALQGTNNFMEAGQMPELAAAFSDGVQPMQPPAGAAPGAAMTTNSPANQAPAQGYYTPQDYPQGYQQGYPQGYRRYPQTSGLAIASLICGVGAFAFCPAAIVAVILGHMARSQIRREPDRYEGDGMALAGLVIGYICMAIGVCVIGFYILFFVLMIGAGAFR